LAGWLDALCDLAAQAGARILDFYERGTDARIKADASPVTDADIASERIILEGLAEIAPEISVISEESHSSDREGAPGRRFFLVDPLDGTREFLKRNGEFTVNIALIEDCLPILGVVHVPVWGVTYTGLIGGGAAREARMNRDHPIRCRNVPAEGLTVVASRSHGDAEKLARFLAGRSVAGETLAGSSLKFCLLAAGKADLYPRFGRTMEWDTAAGHAVLRAAGGHVETFEGEELTYGKPDFVNPAFVARGFTDQA